jgi:predicted CopG family antitoxin
MVTTIQVDEETVNLLKRLKMEGGYKSYNDVILDLAREGKVLRESRFGRYPDLPSFEREEIDRLD